MPRKSKAAVHVPAVTADVGKLNKLRNVSKSIAGFSPATEVLTKVRSHPTIFPLYDRATKVGGHPIERIALVSGPSSMGKTAFAHGIGLSFLKSNNFYAYVDAEYTTPEDWLRTLMAQFADHPGFLAQRPKSYEQTVDSVREFVTKLANARDKGDLDPSSTGIIVVDSIGKLVPRNLLKNMLKGAESDKGSIDGAKGRGAMMKAALNAQWLNELVPLLYHTHTGMIFITREIEQGVDLTKLHEPGGGNEYKTTGGTALIFESSIVARITRGWVKESADKEARVVGERHKITITKTKVSGKQHKAEVGYFHTSNGVLVPAGFDRARDVLELALDAGVITQAGSWLKCDQFKLKWQGVNRAVKALTQDDANGGALLDTLEGEARDLYGNE